MQSFSDIKNSLSCSFTANEYILFNIVSYVSLFVPKVAMFSLSSLLSCIVVVSILYLL